MIFITVMFKARKKLLVWGRMKGLARNSSLYLLANALSAGVPFILLPILARFLTTAEYGVIAMFTAFVSITGVFVGLSAHGAVVRRYFDNELDIKLYVSSVLFTLIISSICFLLILFVLEEWLSSKLSIPVFWLYMGLGASFLSFVMQVRLVLYQVQGRVISYVILQGVNIVLNGVLTVFLVVVLKMGVDGRLYAYLVAFLVAGLLAVILLIKEGYIVLSASKKYIVDALYFGVPLIPHSLGGLLLLTADRIIINNVLGPSLAGIYMVAVQIALGLEVINSAFNKAFVPWLFSALKSGKDRDKLRIIQISYAYIAFLALFAVVIALFSRYIVDLLAGPKFWMAAEVLPWLILAQVFHGMYYLVTNYLFYERKTHITAAITLMSGTFGVLMAWWLVGVLGIVGAAITSAIAMMLQFVLTWIMAQKAYPMLWFGFGAYK